jgi:glycosyltransferase involved in cell wall biosynthesis
MATPASGGGTVSGPAETRRLTVLVVGPVPPPFGGIARYVQDLLESELGARHRLVHFNTSFSARIRSHAVNPGHRRYRADAPTGLAKYGYLFSGGLGQGLRTLLAGLWSVPRFAGCVLRSSPDVVHIFANMHWGFWRAGAMVLIARLLGCRIAFHPLGAIDQFYPGSGAVGRWLISFLLNRADVILVQSPGLAGIVSEYTDRAVRGIFNGIDLTPFSGNGSARERDDLEEGPMFLSVGDLGHNKGTWDIIEAASMIAPDHPNAKWVFVGRGDFDDLRARARTAGIEGQVEFRGAVSDEEKINAYLEAAIFLLPSYGEGQPLSILEAMAAGLPVISTPVGSIAEVIEQETNGLLIPPGDRGALAAAMGRLASDTDLRQRMGQANRERARSRFGAHRLWQELDLNWLEIADREAQV